jgi:hypothetical protein
VARATQKDLLGRLQGISEEAIQKLSEAPGADKMLGAFSSMRDLMDDMQKRVRGLEGLDQRIAGIERRLDRLERGGTASSSSSSGSGSSSPARPATTTKSSGASKTSPSPSSSGSGASASKTSSSSSAEKP